MREARFGRGIRRLLLILGVVAPASLAFAQTSPATYLDQGSGWTNTQRAQFYTQDQGSQMIPLAWLQALKTSDGQPFLWDKWARYGYITNELGTGDLPIGFTLAGVPGQQVVGMTCSACHTRNIVVNNQTYRVDGGPAIVDFQGLLVDMVDAVGRLTTDPAQFQAFATAVLGPSATPTQVAELQQNVAVWYQRENAMRTYAYGKPDIWGLGRLDAITMIFDRLTGIDLAVPPDYMIPGNLHVADAPTRYPFVWNAPKQDVTQWPGFAPNGSEFFGLIRNTGEVYGVFGGLRPTIVSGLFGGKKVGAYNSSANWPGLIKAEELVMQIGAPAWQWPEAVDTTLAATGKTVFKQKCASCHAQAPGNPAFPYTSPTWRTVLSDVGTDSRENDILHSMRSSGVLTGATSFPAAIFTPLKSDEEAIKLLGVAVTGSIFENGTWYQTIKGKKVNTVQVATALVSALVPANKKPVAPNRYESRVLYGIWAAAPYLHNGSVPTLADLLKPVDQRPASFKVGPNYDLVNVGLAADQPGSYVRVTTGCEDIKSGNSRCGHTWGSELPEAKKQALLEYMKVLGSPGWTN